MPFWPLDPGWIKSKIRDEHPGSYFRVNNFWVKILKFFNADPGIFWLWIRHSGWQKFGSPPACPVPFNLFHITIFIPLSRQSARLFLQSSELGPHPITRRKTCARGVWRLKIENKNTEFCFVFKQNLLSSTELLKNCQFFYESGRYFGFESTCFIDCGSMRFVFKSSFIPAARESFRALPYRTNIVMLTVLLSLKLHEIVQFICTKCTRKKPPYVCSACLVCLQPSDWKLWCYYDLLSCVHHLNDWIFNIVVCV